MGVVYVYKLMSLNVANEEATELTSGQVNFLKNYMFYLPLSQSGIPVAKDQAALFRHLPDAPHLHLPLSSLKGLFSAPPLF